MSQYNTAVTGNVPTNVAITFHTQAGDAVPVLNVLNVNGAGGSTTSGAGNTVTITSIANILPWTDENANFLAVVNNGYFCTAALTATLPNSPMQGQTVQIYCDVNNAVDVTADALDKIRIGGDITSIFGGTAVNGAQGDALTLVYRASDRTWMATATVGTWSLN